MAQNILAQCVSTDQPVLFFFFSQCDGWWVVLGGGRRAGGVGVCECAGSGLLGTERLSERVMSE